ncbi:MAG: hypothetical protein OXH52_16255 [Gammaproteobacteria bacterium]|nr:hypothetical protein [Gammaproteobacteria bacterium]
MTVDELAKLVHELSGAGEPSTALPASHAEQATPCGRRRLEPARRRDRAPQAKGAHYHRWRSTLYRRSDWKINVLPWFGRDTAALFTNAWFRDEAERRMAARYRWYVLGYVVLLAGFLWLP